MIIISSARSLYVPIFCIFFTIQPIIPMPPHELSNEPSSSHAFAYLACLCIGAALYAIINTYFFQKIDMGPQNKDLSSLKSPIVSSTKQNEQCVAHIQAEQKYTVAEIFVAAQKLVVKGKEEKKKLLADYKNLIIAACMMASEMHFQKNMIKKLVHDAGHIPTIILYWQDRCKKAENTLEKHKQNTLSPEYKLLLIGRKNMERA